MRAGSPSLIAGTNSISIRAAGLALRRPLKSETSTRSARIQTEAGRPDRRATDDGGHFIAARFGGPKAAYNHFAQDANFNRGAYRKVEDDWQRMKLRGQDVKVKIDIYHVGESRRPHRLHVEWTGGGKSGFRDFANERGGKDE